MTALLVALNDRTFASLRRHRNYRLFFTGQLISVSGTWMQNIALAWLVVELTHSPIAVGTSPSAASSRSPSSASSPASSPTGSTTGGS